MILILMAVTFLVSAFLTQYFSHPKTVLYILDKPNARSLHDRPIPVSGGVAILVAFIPSAILASGYLVFMPDFIWISISGLLIAGISFLDDCHHVSALYRLIVHFIAAYLLLWQGQLWMTHLVLPGIEWAYPSFLTVILSLFFVVWMINLYNFMDGMDGFAGGMALFGFGSLALLGWLADQRLFMMMNLIVASATGGFLFFNFPPAKIFMGDVGASSLGLLAAAFSLWGHREGIFPLWIALLIFSPFIVDATVTLLRRLLQGEKIWLAHKSHYYQKLVESGWGHRRTVLWEYVLMAACSLSALLASQLSIHLQWILLSGWSLIYLLLIHLVNKLERQSRYSSDNK